MGTKQRVSILPWAGDVCVGRQYTSDVMHIDTFLIGRVPHAIVVNEKVPSYSVIARLEDTSGDTFDNITISMLDGQKVRMSVDALRLMILYLEPFIGGSVKRETVITHGDLEQE